MKKPGHGLLLPQLVVESNRLLGLEDVRGNSKDGLCAGMVLVVPCHLAHYEVDTSHEL